MAIMKPPFFQANYGDVVTNTPYRRPTLESFAKWWGDFKNIKGLEKYEIWLIGSFCEKHFGSYKGYPRDLDIVLTGPTDDEEQLMYILSHGIKMGFNNKMLVDLAWVSDLSSYDKWEPFCKIRIAKTFSTILGDKSKTYEYKADDMKRLDCGLWAFCYAEPPNSWFKALHRFETGQYEGIAANVRDMFD